MKKEEIDSLLDLPLKAWTPADAQRLAEAAMAGVRAMDRGSAQERRDAAADKGAAGRKLREAKNTIARLRTTIAAQGREINRLREEKLASIRLVKRKPVVGTTESRALQAVAKAAIDSRGGGSIDGDF